MSATEPVKPSYDLAAETREVDLQSTEAAVHEHSDLREFIVLVRRHALLIVLITLATAGATFFVSLRQPKQYAANTTLLYSPSTTTVGTDTDPTRAIETIVGIGTSNTVLGPISRRFELSLPKLKKSVTVTGDATADLAKIGATSRSPTESAALANGIAQALISYRTTRLQNLLNAQITALQEQLQTLAGKADPSSVAAAAGVRTQLVQARAELAVSSPDLSVLTPAVTPTSAASPHPTRDAAIGLLVGLVLGIMLGVLRDRLDRRTRGIDEVESVYRAPMLGMVPFTKRRAARVDLLADFSGSGLLADAYRTIRTNLSLFRLGDSANNVIVVTSAVAGEGKSAVAANLAHALAVTGKHVLAVSADLHNPTLHEYFGVNPADTPPVLQRIDGTGMTKLAPQRGYGGLVQVLAGDVPVSEAVRVIPLSARERATGGSLALLANSSTFFDPAVLFSSGPMQRFLQHAKQKYDVIVLDTPPLLVNADAALLAQGADIVVLVARLNHLTKNQARRAVRVMQATHISATGIIVTGDVDEPAYGYGYRYGHENFDHEPDAPAEVERPARNRV